MDNNKLSFTHPDTGLTSRTREITRTNQGTFLVLESPYHPKGHQSVETLCLHKDGTTSSCFTDSRNRTPVKTKIIGFLGSCL